MELKDNRIVLGFFDDRRPYVAGLIAMMGDLCVHEGPEMVGSLLDTLQKDLDYCRRVYAE